MFNMGPLTLLHVHICMNFLVLFQSSSDSSDAHHISELVEQLTVDEEEKCVTLVAMAGNDTERNPQYLLHLIAGHLEQPILKRTDLNWGEIQTHYIYNDTLYEEVVRNRNAGLTTLKSEKRKKVMDKAPPFVITSVFPSRTYDETFSVSNVMTPEVQVGGDGLDMYIYKNQMVPTLKITLHEPKSPMLAVYENSQASGSSTIVNKVSFLHNC